MKEVIKCIVKKTHLVFIAIILVVLTQTGCSQSESKINFIVDDEIYSTIFPSGQEIIAMPKDPAKEGYIFDGWYLDENIWHKPFLENYLVEEILSSDMEVYAKWEEIEIYTIEYNLNGGTLKNTNPTTYTIFTDDITLFNPTKEGYLFIGWQGTDLTEITQVVTIGTGATGNRNYEAVWKPAQVTILTNADFLDYFDVEISNTYNGMFGSHMNTFVDVIIKKKYNFTLRNTFNLTVTAKAREYDIYFFNEIIKVSDFSGSLKKTYLSVLIPDFNFHKESDIYITVRNLG